MTWMSSPYPAAFLDLGFEDDFFAVGFLAGTFLLAALLVFFIKLLLYAERLDSRGLSFPPSSGLRVSIGRPTALPFSSRFL
jgi:hypothetical protein